MIGASGGGKAAGALTPDQRREDRIAPEQNPARSRIVGGSHGHRSYAHRQNRYDYSSDSPVGPLTTDSSRSAPVCRVLLFATAAMTRESALPAGIARFFTRPLVRGSLLVSGLSALTGNLALTRAIH